LGVSEENLNGLERLAIAVDSFLLPFGSFKYLVVELPSEYTYLTLSTPFWEFLILHRHLLITGLPPTTFYSLMGVSGV